MSRHFTPQNLNRLFYFLMAVLVLVCIKHTAKHDLDFQVFYRTGQQFLAGNYDFYNLERDLNWTYRYGPLFPLFMAPFAWLGRWEAQFVFGIINALAFPLSWFFMERVLVSRVGEIVRAPSVRILTLFLVLDYVNRNANQGNVNVFMFLAMIWAVDLSDRGRFVWAGVVTGLGAMVKVYPGAAALYFLCARRWSEFVLSIFFTLLFTFGVPALLYGPATLVHQIETWAMILQDRSYYPFFKYINQSPIAVMWRSADDESLGKTFHMLFNFIAALSLGYLVALSIKTKATTERYRHLDLSILLLSFCMPLFVLTCVFIEYHVIATPVIMVANALLLHRMLNRTWLAVYWVRFALVHLAVLAILGRPLTVMIGSFGNHLFGLVALLLLIYFTLARSQAKVEHA